MSYVENIKEIRMDVEGNHFHLKLIKYLMEAMKDSPYRVIMRGWNKSLNAPFSNIKERSELDVNYGADGWSDANGGIPHSVRFTNLSDAEKYYDELKEDSRKYFDIFFNQYQ